MFSSARVSFLPSDPSRSDAAAIGQRLCGHHHRTDTVSAPEQT
jgi:hypothetical protein